MKTIAEALAETMALFAPFPKSVSLALERTLGLFSAADIAARVEVPPFDASLVDGYAVRSADVAPGARLRVVAESRAGGPTPLGVEPGTCARIFTGAPVPKRGADAVVMQEVVTREGEDAIFGRPVAVGVGIRRRGSDIAIGERLVSRGQRIDPGVIGVLASQGAVRAPVHRRPRVGIVTTGDELVTSASKVVRRTRERRARTLPGVLGPHRDLPCGAIFDANGPMLSALVEAAGCEVSTSLHARDDLDVTKAAIHGAWLTSDVVVIAGGVSVGDHDLVHDALSGLAVERRLWKVRMKPGKPLAVGVKGRVPVIGLPGNPVSAWVGFEVFVRPGLRRMLGDPRPYRRVIDVELGAAIRCSVDRTELARARLDDDGVAWPFAKQGLSALTSVTGVDALLILPERDGEVRAGEKVRAMLFDGRGSAQPPFG